MNVLIQYVIYDNFYTNVALPHFFFGGGGVSDFNKIREGNVIAAHM